MHAPAQALSLLVARLMFVFCLVESWDPPPFTVIIGMLCARVPAWALPFLQNLQGGFLPQCLNFIPNGRAHSSLNPGSLEETKAGSEEEHFLTGSPNLALMRLQDNDIVTITSISEILRS